MTTDARRRYYPSRRDLESGEGLERAFREVLDRLYALTEGVEGVTGLDLQQIASELAATGSAPLNITSLPGTKAPPHDSSSPGGITNLSMWTEGPVFYATWGPPAENVETLDNFAIEWSTEATFTTGLLGPYGLGLVYSCWGNDPDKTYYFRFAAHNGSGDVVTNSDADLNAMAVGGWGPWVYWDGVAGSTDILDAVAISTVSGSSTDSSSIFVTGTFTNHSPTSGEVAWSGVAVTYEAVKYSITNNHAGSGDYWIYWTKPATTFSVSAETSPPAATGDTFVIGINASGVFISQWKPGQAIYAGRVVATTLSAISANIGTVTAGTLTGVTVQTASSGERIVLTGTSLTGYNSDNSGAFGLSPTGGLTINNAVPISTGGTISGTQLGISGSPGDIQANGAIRSDTGFKISTGTVINDSSVFIGSGGVDTAGSIESDGSIAGDELVANNGTTNVGLTLGSTGLTENQLIAIKTHCGV